MNSFARLVFNLFVGFVAICCLILSFTPAFAAPPTEPITITAEQMTLIEKAIGEAQNDAAQAHAEKWYWFDEYRDLKTCVRESVKNDTPAALCLGDKDS